MKVQLFIVSSVASTVLLGAVPSAFAAEPLLRGPVLANSNSDSFLNQKRDRNKGGGDGRKVPGAYYGKMRATVPKFLRGIGVRLEMTFSRQPPPSSTEPTSTEEEEEEEDAPAASSVRGPVLANSDSFLNQNRDRNKGGGDGRKVPGAYYGKRATVPKFLRGIGVRLEKTFSRQPPPSSTEPTSTEEEEDAPAASSLDLFSSTGNQCFATRDELKGAVKTYVSSGCNKGANVCPDITSKYGWPMNSWCRDFLQVDESNY